jgi:PAS domain S-box-containing protein
MLDAHDNPKLNEYICKLENEIAKHLETEDKLRDEIHRLRLLVEQSRDGIVILDQYGHVSESNNQFALMLGYTVEETRSLSVWDWDAQFGKAQLQEMIQVVDFKGDHFVTKHRRKDGKIIDVEISTNGLFYKGEKQIFCICRDVTGRIRAEKEREKLIDEIPERNTSDMFILQKNKR